MRVVNTCSYRWYMFAGSIEFYFTPVVAIRKIEGRDYWYFAFMCFLVMLTQQPPSSEPDQSTPPQDVSEEVG